MQWKFQSQGASVTKEPLRYTFLNFSSKWRYWKFSNVIFSNFPIQRIPVLVKNSDGIYRICYFCLIHTPKVTKKRLSEHFCHRWWPKGAIALQRATVTYCIWLFTTLRIMFQHKTFCRGYWLILPGSTLSPIFNYFFLKQISY